MSENKTKKGAKETATAASSLSNSDVLKLDDDSEVASITKQNLALVQAKKSTSSVDLSNPSSTKKPDNPAKKVFGELAQKKGDKKRPNESSSSSISKSDVSKKSEDLSSKKNNTKRPKYYPRKIEKSNARDDNNNNNNNNSKLNARKKENIAGDKDNQLEGSSKLGTGLQANKPVNVDKEDDATEGDAAEGEASIDPTIEQKEGESIERISITEMPVLPPSSSFQPATTIVEKPKKRNWFKSFKSWLCFFTKDDDDDITNNRDGEDVSKVPEIPSSYRPKEISGLGIYPKSQSLSQETRKNYQKLMTGSLELILDFCRYLEVLNERSEKQDIQDSFSIQFARFHSGLPFTDLNGDDALTDDELMRLSNFFNDIFINNNTIWIVNKFEYNSFGRNFRKAIAETLESDYQISISHKKHLFPRQVIAASLIQWKRNISFP
ncbi:hypothetical protein SBY92_001663 [Candida maltosa Xu316]